ncbi:MAG: TonB-dependent receptor [Alphaproteobacteria bacterium]|nr:TonB-dependent receptor [Alphaproteobacteria bacterium]
MRFLLNGKLLASFVAGALPAIAQAQQAPQPQALPEVTVTGTREKELIVETPASIGVIPGETVRLDRPSHPSQIVSQIPGVAVAVTNGEGHTTAIRQPFTTSPVYLFLEDGIPIRSTGFFNHNALYEINLPQAGGIEVIRGPGTALYGSDAIGGLVNILTRTPPSKAEATLFGEVGGHGWWRLLGGGGNSHGDDAWRADLNATHTDGWRDKTGYDRRSGTFRWDRALGGDATLKTVLSFSKIDQETGANSPLPLNDYLNNPTKNNLPIAFRKVGALRLSSSYEREIGNSLVSITPYLRDNSMDLLASFNLNNDPTISYSQNRSYGVQAKWRHNFAGAMRARLIAGVDMEVSPGGRTEDAIRTTTTGAGASRQHLAFTVAGRIYDYDVTYRGTSPYVHGEISPVERLRLTVGLRSDSIGYNFDNKVGGPVTVPAAGGTFPTGVRVYGQAADTKVKFDRSSPKFGATYALAETTHLFMSQTYGFRAPSEGDMFRPSFGTTAAAAQAAAQAALNLKPIKADQLEGGLRGRWGPLSYDVVVYELEKRDDIVSQRDTATNFTTRVNAGRTRHRGLEIGAGLPLGGQFRLDGAFSFASHKYVDFVTSNGDFSGKDIEAAPRTLGNTRLTWTPRPGARLQLEWINVGRYWLDAANTARYGGHDLFNLRGNWPIGHGLTVFATINNLANKRYADSAQISSSTQVFSPGLPRTLYAGLEAQW